MTTTATVFDIKAGDIIAVTGHEGYEEIFTVVRAFEYDGTNTITDQTGWTTTLHPDTPFRYIHRA